jgi:polyisoprenoid-binding protein YceI
MTSVPTTPRRVPLIAVVVLLLVAVAAAGAWYLFLRPSGPAPVALGSIAPSGRAPSGSSGSPGAGPAEGIAGAWTATATGPGGDASFVGYRVREELASIGATEAVGRTSAVTGSLLIEGTTLVEAEITADLTSLTSDNGNRDRQLGRQGLETATYPTGTFVLSGSVDLGAVPADGAVVAVVATGDLTLHGTTKRVEIPLQARLDGGVISVAGSLEIAFADFGIPVPQAMIVLSVEDHGTLELLVHFDHARA